MSFDALIERRSTELGRKVSLHPLPKGAIVAVITFADQVALPDRMAFCRWKNTGHARLSPQIHLRTPMHAAVAHRLWPVVATSLV